MESETLSDIPPVFFPDTVSGSDYGAMIEMYDALFHSAALMPEYCNIESAVSPPDA